MRNTSFLEDYDIKENDDALVFNQIENHNKIDIGKRVSLMSIHTPGHANGGMCFRLVIDDIDNERKYNNNNNNDSSNNDRIILTVEEQQHIFLQEIPCLLMG